MTKPHVIVVGAGIGGSASAALLAHAGLRVTLLEKNRYLGGSCASYEKHGFQIDFGTHLFPRGERGPLGQVLKRVKRPAAIEFRRHPTSSNSGGPDHAPATDRSPFRLRHGACRPSHSGPSGNADCPLGPSPRDAAPDARRHR
ncbi:FAD-dependent oxidoreductase [Saccharothrix yanglingensis]|uniref:FAD-dependent oxidoreductase n=1 Tax=Saccharothrix yanglingensis TaxID=659496 RepID=UPI0027D30E9C|nr:FAD-dependent oxidoreductase [Saccharothrix yanglingensis]